MTEQLAKLAKPFPSSLIHAAPQGKYGNYWPNLKRFIDHEDSGCWKWTGSVSNGYGKARLGKKQTTAHRAVFLALGGKIPEGHHLDHLCRNRLCVNPYHMDAVTPALNLKRRWDSQGRAQTCPHGHKYAMTRTGRKRCRVCEAKGGLARSRQRRAEQIPPPSHGLGGYTNYGCRCDACREAMRSYKRAWKEGRRG